MSLIIYWTQLTKDTKSSGHLEESTISKPRKKRTPREKFKIVMEGLRGDYGSIAALCNAYGITQADFYRWRDIIMEDGSRLFERGGGNMKKDSKTCKWHSSEFDC